jgi:hypothetical protein
VEKVNTNGLQRIADSSWLIADCGISEDGLRDGGKPDRVTARWGDGENIKLEILQ